MTCTKGEWTIEENSYLKTRPYMIKAGSQFIANIDSLANAHLIAAAVNACASVNPDNPMAVAESIKYMYEALKEITELAPRDKLKLPYAIKVVEIADKALLKAEGK